MVSLPFRFLEPVKCCQIGNRIRRRREVCSAASSESGAAAVSEGKSKERFVPHSGAFRERLGPCLWGPALSCCFWTSGGAFPKSVTVNGLSLERSVSNGASPSRLIAGSFSLSHGLSLPEPAESLPQLCSPAFSCLAVPGNL